MMEHKCCDEAVCFSGHKYDAYAIANEDDTLNITRIEDDGEIVDFKLAAMRATDIMGGFVWILVFVTPENEIIIEGQEMRIREGFDGCTSPQGAA